MEPTFPRMYESDRTIVGDSTLELASHPNPTANVEASEMNPTRSGNFWNHELIKYVNGQLKRTQDAQDHRISETTTRDVLMPFRIRLEGVLSSADDSEPPLSTEDDCLLSLALAKVNEELRTYSKGMISITGHALISYVHWRTKRTLIGFRSSCWAAPWSVMSLRC